MDYQYILVDVKDRIATVTINRPEYATHLQENPIMRLQMP